MAVICFHNYFRQTDTAQYCPAGFVDSFDGTGRFKPGEWRRLVKTQDNICLTNIANVRGSRYTGNAIEIRDVLRDYINSLVGLPAIRSCPSRGKESKLTGVMNNMKVSLVLEKIFPYLNKYTFAKRLHIKIAKTIIIK